MNRELEERRTPRADSVSSRTRAYVAGNLRLFIISTFIGLIGFFVILSDSKYHSSLSSTLGNAFGAGFSFGGITFFIGVVVRNVSRTIKRRRYPYAFGHLDSERPNYVSIANPSILGEHLSQSSSPEKISKNQPGRLDSLSEPSILLDDLHPWVKSAATYYWPNGHYRDAVEHVARSVNSQTQQKVWSYKDGTDLMNYVFGMDPPKAAEGRRLRFRGDPKTETWKNRMLAGQALGRACYLGLRNIAAHEQKLDWSVN